MSDLLKKMKEDNAKEVAEGKRCTKCGSYIVLGSTPYSKCYDCGRLDESEEVFEGKRIRCPKCSYDFDPFEADYYEVCEDGDHEISCPDCSHGFEIRTTVKYYFDSPKLLSSEDELSLEDEE